MSKCGTGIDHCCYFKGVVCPYVVAIDEPPFRWRCSLRFELESWDEVHADSRYIDTVRPMFVSSGIPELDCGTYPLESQICWDCGINTPDGNPK